MSRQCEYGMLCDDPDSFRCSSTASRKWGDYWFCEKHGKRDTASKCVTLLPEPLCQDSNVEAVRELLKTRAEAGLSKYGVTTERKDLSRIDWLKHAQAEALDLAVYLQRLISEEEVK